MIWVQTAVFVLSIIAGGSWIASIYIGLEEEPYNAFLYGFWTLIGILGVTVLFEQWIQGRETLALVGAIIGVALTVLMYEPEMDNQQTA